MIRRLWTVALFNAIFSTFADIQSNFLSLLSVPLNQLFTESIKTRYGFVPTSSQLDVIKSVVASTIFIGILSGAYLTGKYMDSFGRKGLAIYLRGTLGLIAAISTILSALFNSIELFALGHFLTGICVSLKIVLVVYLSECAPDESRGKVCLFLNCGNAIMQLISQPLFLPQVFGNSNWIVIPFINLVLCIIHLIVGSFFPPSPKHLYLNKHQEIHAKNSITYYQGQKADLDQIIDYYESEKRLISSEHASFYQIWTNRETKLPFIIICVVSLVPGTSAMLVKSQYLQQILIDMKMSPSSASSTILVLTFIATPFAFLSPILIERMGRRPLFLVMSLFCTIEWAFLGLAKLSSGISIGLFGIGMGNLAVSLGLLSMPPIFVNEICPFAAKAKLTEFIQLAPILVALASVLTYPLISSIGALYHLTMFLISLLLFVTLYRILPETRLTHVDTIVKNLLHEDKPQYGSIE